MAENEEHSPVVETRLETIDSLWTELNNVRSEI